MPQDVSAPYMMQLGDAKEYIRAPLDVERARKKLRQLHGEGKSADLLKFDKASGAWQFMRKVGL